MIDESREGRLGLSWWTALALVAADAHVRSSLDLVPGHVAWMAANDLARSRRERS